jgi:glucose/arabinose dehydrogenase
LGLEFFDQNSPAELRGSYLVALHGSTTKRLGRGYRVVRVPNLSSPVEDFITGFIEGEIIHGRPADIFRIGQDAFLLTDDRAGAVYCVYKK